MKQFDKAKSMFNQALKINSNPYYYWRNLGLAHLFLYEFEQAISAYDNAIIKNQKYDSKYILLFIEKAGILTELSRYEDALSVFNTG